VPALSIIGDFSLEMEARLVQVITGLDMSSQTLHRIGERIVHMEKIINLRQGSSPADDNLPDLFLKTPIKKGPIQGRTVDLAPMVQAFYREMAWDDNGQPKQSVLDKFGLHL